MKKNYIVIFLLNLFFISGCANNPPEEIGSALGMLLGGAIVHKKHGNDGLRNYINMVERKNSIAEEYNDREYSCPKREYTEEEHNAGGNWPAECYKTDEWHERQRMNSPPSPPSGSIQ